MSMPDRRPHPGNRRQPPPCHLNACPYNPPLPFCAVPGGFMAGKPVAIIMGSQSDWATMKHAADTLDELGIGHDARIISAHRTPERHSVFTKGAKAAGFKIIIAGAGGAAHLAGVTAALTTLPVLGVPMESKLSGIDSLYSIVQMPAGIPVGTLAV